MTGLSALALVARITGILLLGFLAAGLLRRRSASARHLAWALALIGALVLPIAAALIPPVVFEILPAAALGGEAIENSPGGGLAAVSDRSEAAPMATNPVGSVGDPARGARWHAGIWLLVALYAVGLVAVGVYFGSGLVRIRSLTRSAERRGDGLVWGDVRAPFASGRSVEVRRSNELEVPVTWGVFQPVVLVPAIGDEWPSALKRQALLHEAAHIDRLDWIVQQLAHLACCVLWFHPLVWIATRRLTLESERACDDRVLLSGVAPEDYAEQLCTVSRRAAEARRAHRNPAPVGAIAFARRAQLSLRIDSILEPQLRRSQMTRQRLLPILILALVPLCIAGTLTVAPAAEAQAAPTQDDSSLIAAALSGDAERVRELLENGADVDAVDPRREVWDDTPRTALAAAARGGRLEVTRILLDAGADVELAPSGEATALMQAAAGGHLMVLDQLIAAGAEVDRAIGGDGTALISASRGGHRVVVERLLALGADPDRVVKGDGSPLIAASRSGSVEVTHALLAAGADPSRAVRGDDNPLIAAVDRGDVEIMQALIAEGVDVNAAVAGDGNALIRAAGNGDAEMVSALLDAGAEINRGVKGDGNPLIAAARRGDLDAVRLLIDRGAEVDRVVPGDENALIGAAAGGYLEVVQFLVEEGADVNKAVLANGREIRTPLNQAVRGGHGEVADWLRSVGAVE